MGQQKYLLYGFGSVVVVFVAIIAVGKFRSNKEKLEPIIEGPAIEAIYAIGTVDPVRSFQAKAGVAAVIDQIPAREGSLLQKGDLIAVMSEGFSLRAPFPGVVTRVNYKIGESVFQGNVIAEIIDPSQLEVKVVLDQRAAVRVSRGQKAKLSFDGLRDRSVAGEVRTVFSSDSRFTVMIDAKDLPQEILPGMTADVSIEISRKDKAILAPAAAINKGSIVRVRDGRRETITVRTGLSNEDKVEIIDGDLRAGDMASVPVK